MVTRSTSLLAATLIFTSICLGQSPADQQPAPAPGPNSTILQTSTKLVVVDVVVQDANGKPIHGLKASNFKLSENKNPQQISHFDEHMPPPVTARGPDIGKMPPGVFTNYTPVAPGSTLNVLLLDALNTPTLYQTWVREQLKKYVNEAPPGQRIAIFGLTDHLILLQGFTSDPQILKNIIDHKLISRSSPLLSDPVGSGSSMDMAEDPNLAETPDFAAFSQFDAEVSALQTEVRIQATLDAFNALAHYLAGFPGRKNLLWFSGSFPGGVFANASTPTLFGATSNTGEIQDTAATFASAQVAVYPIDARGLMTNPAFNVNNNSSALAAPTSRGAVQSIQSFSMSQADEHATMLTLAGDTGGHAYIDTNGITQAVRDAMETGSNYYTLTYAPNDHNWNRAFRSIQVKLVDVPSDVKLSYRSGYFAVPPRQPREIDPAALSSGPESTASATPGSHHSAIYDRLAMTRGAPTPEDIIFKVRVLPISVPLETKLAPDNTLDPNSPAKGPFHRYAVDYALQPSEITLIPQPNGNHAGQVKFTVYVYDANGKLLVAAHRGFNLTLNPDLYAKFIKAALQCHMEISVPDKTDAYLRIAVQDMPSDKFGVVELPAAAVSRLPPLPAAHTAPAH